MIPVRYLLNDDERMASDAALLFLRCMTYMSVLLYFGYELKQGGTGSGVKFIKDGSNEVINFHKPHPNGMLKRYVLDQVIEKFRKEGLL